MPGPPPRVGDGIAESTGMARQACAGPTDTDGDKASLLMEEVVSRENLLLAYRRVKRNQGAPGVDGMTVDDLMPYCREHWSGIREQLLRGTYRPGPIRKVEIPKPGGGGMRALGLIHRFLQAGMMAGGVVSPRTAGTPQGGPLSPLLSNILLDDLDKELERRGHRFTRYADDCNVYVRSKAAGERVMASLERFLRAKLRLKVHPTKSAVARPWARKFLGYSVTVHYHPKLKVATESVRRFKQSLRQTFRAGRGRRVATVLRELAPKLRGWVAYFRLSEVRGVFELLDQWLRRKLRALYWRQWKRWRANQGTATSGSAPRPSRLLRAEWPGALVECRGPPHEPGRRDGRTAPTGSREPPR